MIKIKHGVKMHGLKTSMIKPISFLDKIFMMVGVDFVITDAKCRHDNSLKGMRPSENPEIGTGS